MGNSGKGRNVMKRFFCLAGFFLLSPFGSSAAEDLFDIKPVGRRRLRRISKPAYKVNCNAGSFVRRRLLVVDTHSKLGRRGRSSSRSRNSPTSRLRYVVNTPLSLGPLQGNQAYPSSGRGRGNYLVGSNPLEYRAARHPRVKHEILTIPEIEKLKRFGKSHGPETER